MRAERGWTLQDVARIADGTRSAARREKAWRWENWDVVPDLASQEALARALGLDPEIVRRVRWPAWLPDGQPIRTDYAWTQRGSLESLADALEYAALDRRAFMKVLGPSLINVADQWLGVEPAALTAVLRGGQVASEFVASMEAGLCRLRLLEATRGGEPCQAIDRC
ncbi:helix-turn-helix transcriptional regulator [Actinoplanes sp. NPDC051346]|uniref:helix-turn-helix domain-containing protein n=1 Tax=Actinoplanes sp. NPDC051346 TaxID=3155048 RepID=UPI00341AF416